MNRNVIFGVALGIALIGPVSAASFRYTTPASTNLRTIAGKVRADGTVLQGNGFTTRRLAMGQYEIHFANDALRGCAAMVVTAAFHYLVASARQKECSERFIVQIGTDTRGDVDDAFQFIVAE